LARPTYGAGDGRTNTALDGLINDVYRPLITQAEDIVRDLMGRNSNDDVVLKCTRSILGQCLYYYHSRPVIQRMTPHQQFEPADIEQLAVHITKFFARGSEEYRFVNFVALNVMRLLAVGLVLTAGCAVGPNYHPTEDQSSRNWSEAQAGGGDQCAAVQFTDWWKTFHDPELDSLIERAVKANYELAHRRSAVIAGACAAQRRGVGVHAEKSTDRRPFTDRQTSRNVQTGSTTNTVLSTHLYDAGFDASWEIDIFGGLRRQLQQANAQYASIEDQRRVVLISVMAESHETTSMCGVSEAYQYQPRKHHRAAGIRRDRTRTIQRPASPANST